MEEQILCFMADGTSRHLTYFDQLAQDPGYAGSIETDMKEMASSHRGKLRDVPSYINKFHRKIYFLLQFANFNPSIRSKCLW